MIIQKGTVKHEHTIRHYGLMGLEWDMMHEETIGLEGKSDNLMVGDNWYEGAIRYEGTIGCKGTF